MMRPGAPDEWIMAVQPSRASPPEPALIGAVIQRAVAEIPRRQHLADENERGAIDAGFRDLADDGAERGPDDPLVRPAGAEHHGNRTAFAIGGNEFGDGLV